MAVRRGTSWFSYFCASLTDARTQSIDAYAQLINVRATHYAAAERDKKRVPYVHVFSNFTVVPTGVASGVPSLAGPPLPEQGSVKIRNISEEELMADANHIARCDVAIFPMMGKKYLFSMRAFSLKFTLFHRSVGERSLVRGVRLRGSRFDI